MVLTSPSLLERLRQPNQPEAWSRFVELYTPLLCHWGRQLGLHEAEVADLVQEVLLHLLRKLPDFVYEPDKSFRAWLRTVMLNKWRNLAAKRRELLGGSDLGEIAAPGDGNFLEETEYRERVVAQAVQILKAEFPASVWQPFWLYAIDGKPPTDVARELGLSVNSVYLAKSRVLARLRQDLRGLID